MNRIINEDDLETFNEELNTKRPKSYDKMILKKYFKFHTELNILSTLTTAELSKQADNIWCIVDIVKRDNKDMVKISLDGVFMGSNQ